VVTVPLAALADGSIVRQWSGEGRLRSGEACRAPIDVVAAAIGPGLLLSGAV